MTVVWRSLVLAIALLAVPPVATGAEPNRWEFLFAAPATGVHAHLSLGAATPGQNVYIGIGGGQLLDIIQVGAKLDATGRHLFAAWGRGVPNGPDSLYDERDLGPISAGTHAYTLRLVNGVWTMTVDGSVRLRVPDSFRTWRLGLTTVANETETGGALGGTQAAPVLLTGARVWRNGAWRLPAIGRWYVGGYRVPADMHIIQGADRLEVWHS